ncbi:MAG TPA: Gfo/Idh/MocA family oxidoreductase [Acidimicrobiales bacterium]|jgi:predicted dehydrogenase
MTVRVGFLGAGLSGSAHAASLRRSGAPVAWAGVHDPDRSRAEAFAAATGAPVCDREEDVIEAADAVYVCTWTSEHPRLVEAAAARGRAVFCEKPLATDLAGARRMTEVVAEAGVVNQVGLVLRRSPAFALVRALVRDPASGRVMAVVFRDDQYLPVRGVYDSTWRADVARAGAGVLVEHSIHDVDLLEHVVGPVESVAARSARFHDLPGIEDAVALTVGFASGAVGSLVSVWHDMLERPNHRRLEVVCESAWVALENDWNGPVRWRRADGPEHEVAGEALLAEVAHRGLDHGNPDGAFVEAVAAGRPAWPDFATALRAHVVVDAAYRSAAAGGAPVAVPDA